MVFFVFFFFQAEDGIRDFHVTGVQTCALPIFTLDETYELIDMYYEEGGEVENFFMMILEEYAKSMGLGNKFKEIIKQQQN